MGTYQIINADLISWLKEMNETDQYQEAFHVSLADWPYNLDSIQKRFGKPGSAPARPGKDGAFIRKSKGFMGQTWDGSTMAYEAETWELIKPLLKPGAFTASFTHVRKQHRLAVAQEDAGYLIQPAFYNYHSGCEMVVPAQFGWAYGSGMAHGTSISKAIDRRAGVERGKKRFTTSRKFNIQSYGGNNMRPWINQARKQGYYDVDDDTPITPLAQTWHGHQYGSPLAPEIEPIIIAQKPWQGNRLNSILETGVGAWNVAAGQKHKAGDRFPGTLLLEHHPCCIQVGVKEVRNRSGDVTGNEPSLPLTGEIYGQYNERLPYQAKGNEGIELIPAYGCHPDCHVARLDEKAYYFFQSDWSYEIAERLALADPLMYCGKVGNLERNAGCEDLPERVRQRVNPGGLEHEARFANTVQGNNHPTLKPIKMLKFLCELLLPPASYAPRRIIIFCAGTGSEIISALLAGWDEVIGIEISPEYVTIAEARLKFWSDWMAAGQSDVDTILAAYANGKKEEEKAYQQLKF